MQRIHDPLIGVARQLAALDEADRSRVLAELSPALRRRLALDVTLRLRDRQIVDPGSGYRTTAIIGGRGSGKTFAGAAAVKYTALHAPHLIGGRDGTGEGAVNGIAGRTHTDSWETLVNGPSGIMAACLPDERPLTNTRVGKLTWRNGAITRVMSGDAPESFRGPNFGLLWSDELPYWQRGEDSIATALDALRIGVAHHLITVTPRMLGWFVAMLFVVDARGIPEMVDGRPVPLDRVDVRGMPTHDNAANLAPDFIARLDEQRGTDRYRQEVLGQLVLTSPGAVLRHEQIRHVPLATLRASASRAVVVVDPSVTSHSGSAETGIVILVQSHDRRVGVCEDRSRRGTPAEWGDAAVQAAIEYGAEVWLEDNQGGEMVEEVVRGRASALGVPCPRTMRLHAQRSKRQRWESAAMAYASGSVDHAARPNGEPMCPEVEHQITATNPDDRAKLKDRADCWAWGIITLTGREQAASTDWLRVDWDRV